MKKPRARRQPKRSKPLREEDKPAGPYRYFGGGLALPESVQGDFTRAERAVLEAIRANARGKCRLCRLTPKALAEVAGVSTTKAQNVIKRALAEGLVRQTDDGLVNLAIKEWTVLGHAQW